MTGSEPYKLFRGRPIKNAAWNALVSKSSLIVENDEDAEQELLETIRLDKQWPRGCSKWSASEKYYCQMYLGGAQRHIAKGTLYQCAKFYDYALIFFDSYRVRKTITKFNFDKADNESDMLREPAIGEYLSTLEKYLLESGVLALPGKKSEAAKEKQRAREHKRTIAGTIETWMQELQPYIFEIADAQDKMAKRLTVVETQLNEAHKKLDELRKLVQVPPT